MSIDEKVIQPLKKNNIFEGNLIFKNDFEIRNLFAIGKYINVYDYFINILGHQIKLPNNEKQMYCRHYIKNGYCTHKSCKFQHPNRGNYLPAPFKEIKKRCDKILRVTSNPEKKRKFTN